MKNIDDFFEVISHAGFWLFDLPGLLFGINLTVLSLSLLIFSITAPILILGWLLGRRAKQQALGMAEQMQKKALFRNFDTFELMLWCSQQGDAGKLIARRWVLLRYGVPGLLCGIIYGFAWGVDWEGSRFAEPIILRMYAVIIVFAVANDLNQRYCDWLKSRFLEERLPELTAITVAIPRFFETLPMRKILTDEGKRLFDRWLVMKTVFPVLVTVLVLVLLW